MIILNHEVSEFRERVEMKRMLHSSVLEELRDDCLDISVTLVTVVGLDEEETQASRKQKQLERAKKRALHSSVIDELREEYLDTPAEVSHGNTLRASTSRLQRQRNQ